LVVKGPPASRQPAFAAGHQARYPAGYTTSIRSEDRRVRSRFPVAFRPPAFASWASCSRPGIQLSSRSACRPAPRRRPPDPDGVSTFHTHEIRPGRVSSLPRGRRCSYDHRCVRGRRLPPLNGRPLPPRYNQPTRDVRLTRHQQGFSVIHPFGLPLAGDTRSGRAPLGFPLSFAPSRYRPRTSGRGQVWNTDPSHVFGVTPNLQSTNLLITCDIVSQRTRLPRFVASWTGRLPVVTARSYAPTVATSGVRPVARVRPPEAGTERETLTGLLDFLRSTQVNKVAGLTDGRCAAACCPRLGAQAPDPACRDPASGLAEISAETPNNSVDQGELSARTCASACAAWRIMPGLVSQ